MFICYSLFKSNTASNTWYLLAILIYFNAQYNLRTGNPKSRTFRFKSGVSEFCAINGKPSGCQYVDHKVCLHVFDLFTKCYCVKMKQLTFKTLSSISNSGSKTYRCIHF